MESPSDLVHRLAQAIAEFGAQLGSASNATLTQAWLPTPAEDGSMQLKTVGHPYSISGCGDLLALFRCSCCRYEFSVDSSKVSLMGAVGRVYTSGEAEFSKDLASYDVSVYIRAPEAKRCKVNCCMILPLYLTPARDRPCAVLEVVQTEQNALFPALLDWARCCLQKVGLYTTNANRDFLPVGLRVVKAEMEASAFESGVCGKQASTLAPAPFRMLAAHVDAFPGVPRAMLPPRPQAPAALNQPSPPQQQLLPPKPVPALSEPVPETALWQYFNGAAGASVDEAAGTAPNMPTEAQHAAYPHASALQAGDGLPATSDAPLSHCTQTQPLGKRPPSAAPSGSAPPAKRPTSNAAHGGELSAALLAQRAASQPPAASYGQGDRVLTLNDLRPHYDVPLKQAAAKLGVGVTTLKRACRRLGVPKWPRRERAAGSRCGGSHGSVDTISTESSGDQPQRLPTSAPALPPSLLTVSPLLLRPSALPPSLSAVLPGYTSLAQLLPLPVQRLWAAASSAPAVLPSAHCPSLDSGCQLESLDILAAADFELSVGNSPPSAGYDFPSEGVFSPLNFAPPGQSVHAHSDFNGTDC